MGECIKSEGTLEMSSIENAHILIAGFDQL